jgi:hypothetical protein
MTTVPTVAGPVEGFGASPKKWSLLQGVPTTLPPNATFCAGQIQMDGRSTRETEMEMSDEPQFRDFGSSEALLAYIKELSDDIERVIILPPGAGIRVKGQLVGSIQEFQMMLCLVGDQRQVIGQLDAELLLNDGILSRMKLRIEFMKRPS